MHFPPFFPFFFPFLHDFSSAVSYIHISDLIWLQKPNPLSYIVFHNLFLFSLFHQGTLLTFSSPIFPFHSSRGSRSYFFLFCCFLLHFFALYFSWSCRESGEQASLPVGWFLTKHKAFFSFDLVMLCLLTFFLFVSFFLFIHFLKIFSHFVQLWLFTSN